MKLFTATYRKMMEWARHPHAPYYLMGISFVESSFFPVPPDAMLIPMSMAAPKRAVFYASLATVGSTLGGMIGYLIGMLFFDAIHPWIIHVGYEAAYQQVQIWFLNWGFWAIFVAGFSPIPYKLFTIGAGAVSMPFVPFVVASIIGRSTRFFLVSVLMAWGGERLETMLLRYVEITGWLMVFGLVLTYFIFEARHLHWFFF